jgi:hypothetical protein
MENGKLYLHNVTGGVGHSFAVASQLNYLFKTGKVEFENIY